MLAGPAEMAEYTSFAEETEDRLMSPGVEGLKAEAQLPSSKVWGQERDSRNAALHHERNRALKCGSKGKRCDSSCCKVIHGNLFNVKIKGSVGRVSHRVI